MKAESPAKAKQHVDEVTGLLYIEGQLEQAEARGVVAHLEQCSECRRLLDSLKRESLLLRQALTEEDEAVPQSLLVPRISQGLSWWWLSVLSLAAAGVYTLWTYYLDPWVASFQQSGFDGQFFFTWLLLNGASWKGWDEMFQWVILGSLAVLASVLLFLFRRNLRRLTSLSIFLAALLLLAVALPPAAQGAEFVKRSKGSYELLQGETVKTDLYVMAAAVRISGNVEGDMFCFCSTLTVEGHVTGDVFAFASSVTIPGKVDGSVRAFTGHLLVEGDVGRNVMSFVGSMQTSSHSHVQGSAMVFVGEMQLDGSLGRDLCAYLGEGTLNGPIGGDVLIRQDTTHRREHWGGSNRPPVQVASQAVVKGGFHVIGPERPEVSPAAHLASAPQFDLVEDLPAYRNPKAYWYNAMIWGSGLLVGLVLISLFPGFVHDAANQVAKIGAPLGLGLVTMIVMPVAACLACFTVVGLGLGIPILFLWLFLLFFAQIFTAIWIGEMILGGRSGAWALTGRLALGLLLIRLGALLPILGFWVRLVAGMLGYGALALILLRRFQTASPEVPAAPVPAAPGA